LKYPWQSIIIIGDMSLTKKCPACGTSNYYTRPTCGRCGALLSTGNAGNNTFHNDPQTTRLLLLVILVVIVVIVAVLVWQFSPKLDSSTTKITNITFDMVTSSGARISWQTAEPASSQVMYGKTSGYGMVSPFYPANDPTVQGSSGVTSHSVILTGLAKNTWYHFKVKSKTKNGNESISSEDMIFRTGDKLDFAGAE
jgi:hypothetical protein